MVRRAHAAKLIDVHEEKRWKSLEEDFDLETIEGLLRLARPKKNPVNKDKGKELSLGPLR